MVWFLYTVIQLYDCCGVIFPIKEPEAFNHHSFHSGIDGVGEIVKLQVNRGPMAVGQNEGTQKKCKSRCGFIM